MRTLTLFTVSLLACPARALTPPEAGARAKPVDLPLRLPFEDGARVRIISGYGPNAGSSLHRDTNRGDKANDHHALDLVLPDHPNNGMGQVVVAAAGGRVIRAGWATQGWANYGLRVIIATQGPDGATYHHSYCHLDQLSVRQGDDVAVGQPIGTLGDSCQGDQQNRACPHFSPHLHFVLHRESLVGGSGTGGSYGGQAVVPEVMDGYQDLQPGQVLVAGNGGPVGPQPPCQVIPAEGGTLEEDGPCHRQAGDPRWWHPEDDGHGGHLVWTTAIDDPAPDNHARWDLHLAQAGEYAVQVHIEPAFGQSRQARYVVRAGGQEAEVRLDQSVGGGWRDLGRFRFAEGGDQWVALYDNTGEALGLDRKLCFDAVRLQPAMAPPPPPEDMAPPPPPVDMAPPPVQDMAPPLVADLGVVDRGAPADQAPPPGDGGPVGPDWSELGDAGVPPIEPPRADAQPAADASDEVPLAPPEGPSRLQAQGCRSGPAPAPLVAVLMLGLLRWRRR